MWLIEFEYCSLYNNYAHNYYYQENYPEKACLVLGSEGNGMRKKVKEHCDKIVKIHLKGEINSLNVSVAGGIILAEMSK